MKPWWEIWPERLDFELQRLQAAGVRIVKDHRDVKAGVVELELEHVIHGHKTKLIARYPAFFPYTRFELFAPELTLTHHQNPFLKNLCLLGRATTNWEVTDTLAEFISQRLPRVLEAAAESDKVTLRGVEEQQAEPISAYYPYAPDSLVLVDSSWQVPNGIE